MLITIYPREGREHHTPHFTHTDGSPVTSHPLLGVISLSPAPFEGLGWTHPESVKFSFGWGGFVVEDGIKHNMKPSSAVLDHAQAARYRTKVH